jgi:hypothetical protein
MFINLFLRIDKTVIRVFICMSGIVDNLIPAIHVKRKE